MKLFNLSMIIVFLIIFGCASVPKPTEFGYYSNELFEKKMINYDTSANAVKLFDIATMSVKSYPFEIIIERRVRIKVLNEAGKEHANIRIPYYKDEVVSSIKAQTILPDGKIIKLKKSNIIIEVAEKNYKEKVFAIPGVQKNSIIEYRYNLISGYLHNLDSWYFQDEIPTELSRITVKLIQGFAYTYSSLNLPVFDYKPEREEFLIENNKKGAQYTWEFTDLPAITDEPYMTTIKDNLATLDFQLKKYKDAYNDVSFMKDWGEFQEEVMKRYNQYFKSNNSVKKLANKIIDDEIDITKKTTKIYNFVRDNIENTGKGYYLSYNLKSPSKVISEKKGNSIEKNLLLISLLNAINVDAKPLLISTRNHGRLLTLSPRIRSFNHMIVYVESYRGGLFLDTKDKYCPFGILPSSDHNYKGLLIDENSHKFIDISPKKTISKKKYNSTNAILDDDGNLELETTITFENYQNMYFRKKLGNSKSEEEFIDEYILDDFDNAILDTFTIEIGENKAVPFTLNIKFKINNFANVIGDMMYFSPGIFLKLEENIFKLNKRNYSVDFNYLRMSKEDVIFILPDGFEVNSLPENEVIRMDGLDYYYNILKTDAGIQYYRMQNINKNVIFPDKYQRLKSHYSRIVDADQRQIVLKKVN